MKEYDLPKLKIETDENWFSIIFKRKVSKNVSERDPEKLGEKLGENQIKILELINKNKDISIPQMAEELNISTTAIENNLAKLKKKDLLRRVGPNKGGYWEIIKKL